MLSFKQQWVGLLLLVWKICCCKSGQQNKAKGIGKTSLESVSSSETDVTVNLSTFAGLLATKTAQKVSKQMDGPQ